MASKQIALLGAICLSALALWACSTVIQADGKLAGKNYSAAADLYGDYLAQHPQDTRARSKLGFAYLKSGRLNEAVDQFETVLKADPGNPHAVLYLGLAYLNLEELGGAVATWQTLQDPKQPLVAAEIKRLLTLVQIAHNHREAIDALAKEEALMRQAAEDNRGQTYQVERGDTLSELAARFGLTALELRRINRIRGGMIRGGQRLQTAPLAISPVRPSEKNTIGVCYYKDFSPDHSLRAFQKGLAAMVASDLAKVSSLRVLERMRLQALFAEMKLGQTGIVDPRSAPRTGRLLGAEHLVVGTLAQGSIHTATSLAATGKKQVVATATAEVPKEKFFSLPPQIVRSILAMLAVPIAPGADSSLDTPHTTSYPAFIYYGQALDALDAGSWQNAQDLFTQALNEDPRFDLAREGRDATPDPTAPAISHLRTMSGALLADFCSRRIDKAAGEQAARDAIWIEGQGGEGGGSGDGGGGDGGGH